jgi:flavin-binding protein dodecin
VSDAIYKSIEVTGSSAKSIEDAVRGAVSKASETVHNLDWVQVTEIRGHIDGDQVEHFQVTTKIGFRLD